MTSSNGNIFRVADPLCGEFTAVTGELPSQRPVTQSLDVFFDRCLNKGLSKHSWRRWFETPSRSLWRQCTVKACADCMVWCQRPGSFDLGSGNGWAPVWPAINWTNVVVLSIRPRGLDFTEILIQIQTFSFKKIPLKISFAKFFTLSQTQSVETHIYVYYVRTCSLWRLNGNRGFHDTYMRHAGNASYLSWPISVTPC